MSVLHAEPPATGKGRATRDRIVAAAADLMYRNGVAGTSTPAVRAAADVSSSQIYHYFADKEALAHAVVAHQADSVVAVQLRMLARVSTWEELVGWRNAIVRAARRQHGDGGCPLGSLVTELAADPGARAVLADGFTRWQAALRDALERMTAEGSLRADTPIEQLAAALLAAVQGGLLLAQVHRSTARLAAALDTTLGAIDTYTVRPPTDPS